ncbi:MAG: UDP-N-acetylglucosamine 2-epimerase (non-hydrolyzing) [Candidatus Omnitrophica bacterium]|nr:UDP-N-acetylglucosamine 2-epimerase (non-hydrolyzing) [Candidatus Omnitrophota bacterium]
MIKTKYNIIIVFGTRPEAIKMAPVIREFKKYRGVNLVNVSVSQHIEMLKQVLQAFDINLDYNLNIMSNNQTLFSISRKALKGFEKILTKINPDLIVVQGDTTSAFIGALSAYYKKIPVAHIEAGLRTYDKYSPFPEEANRRLISVIADYNFAPTLQAKKNLLLENIDKNSIYITGNTGIDALLFMARKKTSSSSSDNPKFAKQLASVDFDRKIILITAHRRESFGSPLKNICNAIRKLSKLNPNVEFIYPVHLNPNVNKPVFNALSENKRIHLVPPLSYDVFVQLMKRSHIILTDSGGIQEEAPSLNIPVLVMREVTERPEAIKAGVARLVGTNKAKIVEETQKLLNNKRHYELMATGANPYGDGYAAHRIVKCLLGKKFYEFNSKVKSSGN